MRKPAIWIGIATLAVVITCAMAVVIAQQEEEDEEEYVSHPDFNAQKATCGAILGAQANVEAFKSDFPGKKLPTTLSALHQVMGGVDPDGRLWLDGWGRPLVFFVTWDGNYVIASFGKDGVPQGQAATPGGATIDTDRDADIVMINGEWAQKPGGVGGMY